MHINELCLGKCLRDERKTLKSRDAMRFFQPRRPAFPRESTAQSQGILPARPVFVRPSVHGRSSSALSRLGRRNGTLLLSTLGHQCSKVEQGGCHGSIRTKTGSFDAVRALPRLATAGFSTAHSALRPFERRIAETISMRLAFASSVGRIFTSIDVHAKVHAVMAVMR
jgi:hypothetical protein